MSAAESLPSDLAAAHAMILVERAARIEAEAVAARAAAEKAASQTQTVRSFERRRPSRKPFPSICRASAS